MKLWRISQTINAGYDTFSDAVVAAETEDQARLIHPGNYQDPWDGKDEFGVWTCSDNVKVEYLGEATSTLESGVICASFHAG